MHTLYTYRLAAFLMGAVAALPLLAWGQESPPEKSWAKVEAALDHNEVSQTWTYHVTGSFGGPGARVPEIFLEEMEADGQVQVAALYGHNPDDPPMPMASPFSLDFSIPKPSPEWTALRVGIRVLDDTGSTTEARSGFFPILWQRPIVLDHAVGGSTITAPNYDFPGLPSGIGIPHPLINSLAEGVYYVDVFFEGLSGCPSEFTRINSFRDGQWGSDVVGPMQSYSTAYASAGGGCMQKFYLDPKKGEGWYWGALSVNATSSAIGDKEGIPAFAICATKEACDPIIPSASTPTRTPSAGISSVLFLPGIKGSKLYEDNPLCLLPLDSCGIQMWLPLADAAVPNLFLDAAGHSKRRIFVRDGGILASALGEDFYESFVESLDQARTEETFGSRWSWKPAAYDWRLSLPDLLAGGAQHGTKIYFGETTGTPYLEQSLRELASSSPTGKVSIVAHSNGGLVAKALLAELGDTLSSQLVDKVIFVGVPQSGAPRALGALLYGDSEGLPGLRNVPNFIMSTAHAREFGLNSPMAYHLLPSARYVSAKQPNYPLVRFDDALASATARYGPVIDTPAELRAFSLAENGDREQPQPSDLEAANVLNPLLYSYAEKEHGLLDGWEPPPGVEVYQLGGYGVPTISGIDMYEAPHADGSATVAYRPLFISDGDGTVPIISALMMNATSSVHQLWLDLPEMHAGDTYYSHGTLLEAPDIEASIRDILLGSDSFPSTVQDMEVARSTVASQLAFYVHSPVSLTVKDALGNESSVGTNETAQAIPGSATGTLGDVKYVVAPEERGPFSLVLAGQGEGTFTLDVEELKDGAVIGSSTIADVPVTSATRARITLESIASSSPLAVDENGDGTADLEIAPRPGATVFPQQKAASLSISPRRLPGRSATSSVSLAPAEGITKELPSLPSSSTPATTHLALHASRTASVLGASTSTVALAVSHATVDTTSSVPASRITFLRRALDAIVGFLRRLGDLLRW